MPEKLFVLYDGRAKDGNPDAASVLDNTETELEARESGAETWEGYDAIWWEYDLENGVAINGKARWDLPPVKTKIDLGAVIKECRERRGFSQKDLARKSGYTTGTIAAWEDGTLKPSHGAVRDISTALGMPEEMLFFLAADTDKLTGMDKNLAEALKRTTMDLLGAIKPSVEI